MLFKRRNITKLNDEELMLAICFGDQAAFSELYERYNQRLFYFFYRMLGNDKELANDFLQDIFYKIINKPEQYNCNFKFSSWIYSIAQNMCKNEYRKREVRKNIINDNNIDCLNDETTVNETTEKEELITHVFTELNKLEEIQRSVLILKYKENFSLKEIAEILELPEGTIKSRLHYARLELSKRVTDKKLL